MKILVTGGSGRIGLRIIETLQKSGYDVINFDIFPQKGDFEFVKGNVTDRQAIENVTNGVDAVVHLAAYPTEPSIPSYPEGWDVNCTGTFNVFEASAKNGVKKVAYASSICATGILTWVKPNNSIEYFPVDERHTCKPQNLYGTSKLISEKIAFMYSKRSNTTFIGLRIATVWFDKSDGEPAESTKNLIENYVKDPSAVFKQSHSSIPLNVNALKDLTWQYVGVSDVAEAFKLAIEKEEAKSCIYNIGAADTCSTWDSLKLAQYFYPGVPIRNQVAFFIDPKKALWDISKAQRELGYRPKFSWTEFMKKL